MIMSCCNAKKLKFFGLIGEDPSGCGHTAWSLKCVGRVYGDGLSYIIYSFVHIKIFYNHAFYQIMILFIVDKIMVEVQNIKQGSQ